MSLSSCFFRNWGHWSGPADNVYSSMKYDRGQHCWNGPDRSVEVSSVKGGKPGYPGCMAMCLPGPGGGITSQAELDEMKDFHWSRKTF